MSTYPSPGSASLPTVSIIVLNYNSWDHLQDNFRSLLAMAYPKDKLELILADNASTDGSVEWVSANYPTINVLQNGSNLGFAAGNLAGVEEAHGEWVVILNPDTRVKADWLMELVQPVLEDPELYCVASRMLSWDGKTIDFADAAINFMGWGCQPGYGSHRLHEFESDKPLLFACGGAMLIKRQLFLDSGGFDPEYYAYFEDVDLGWRLSLMGYKVALASKAIVYHRHHGSWDQVADAKKWVLAERNTLFGIIKNYSDDNLSRILPAALLLTIQRAFLDIRPDPSAFAAINTPTTPTGTAFGPRYYANQIRDLLGQGSLKQLFVRTTAELKRRWAQRGTNKKTPVLKTYRQPIDGQFQVPAVAISRLVGCRDVKQGYQLILSKRADVQSRRILKDEQVFPLFQWPLISNFDDSEFIHAMKQVIAKFQLDHIFSESLELTPLSAADRQLGLEVAGMLLDEVDTALELTGVPDSYFRIGQPDPPAELTVPSASIGILAEINRLIWSLPDAPLPELFSWLKAELENIT